MRIGALSLFEKTNTEHHYNLAAWHWYDSLTWSWILSWHPRNRSCRRGLYSLRRVVRINLPLLGDFSFHRQRALRGYYMKNGSGLKVHNPGWSPRSAISR